MEVLYTAHVPAGDGPFPTILALHGWGASAHDLLGLSPILHGGQALVLCPQGPVEVEIQEGIVGYGWFPISTGGPIDPLAFEAGRHAVASFLDAALERYPVDRKKLVLMGFSQGGVMAYDLALRQPERFAGLVAMSSWLPPQLVDEVAPTPALQNLPTLVIHGSEDPMIPVSMAVASRDALLRLEVPTVYREYAMGHEIRPEALRELLVWLEEKVISPIQLL
jgi:phospholipase/carboxylesterase